MTATIGKRAIVVGAGIAGLAAAGALARSFEEVLLLERDSLTDEPVPRSGVSQSPQPHALLVGGARALLALYPGFGERLLRAGGLQHNDRLVRWERAGYDPFPQRDFGTTVYFASRPLLELTLRHELEAFANVVVRDGARVEALTASADGNAVTGVRYTASDAAESVSADLVIDATGRGAPTSKFLEAAGRPQPATSAIGINIDYSTALYAIPKDGPEDWVAVATLANAPTERHGAVMLPIEGGRWIVTMTTRHPDGPPPATEVAFLAHARGLRTQTVFDAVARAKCLSSIARFRFAGNVRTHWERLERFPRGLLLIGDAACRFNPIYGQGMSVAAQEAVMLRDLLGAVASAHDPLEELRERYFQKLAEMLDAPWSTAVADLIYPETVGTRPEHFEQATRFSAALLRLAAQDVEVHRLMSDVMYLLRPPSILRDPSLQQRVAQLLAAPTA